jgi:transposase
MLHPQESPSVHEETHRVACAAFPKGTLCLHIADALGPIDHDGQFVTLFLRRGQPAEAPGRLALATVLQYVEGLSDRQAADAVRGRIDWKYALGLSLTDPGFDHTVLSEFRSRLIDGGAERLLLDTLLRRLREQGLVKAGGRFSSRPGRPILKATAINAPKCFRDGRKREAMGGLPSCLRSA